MKFKLIEELLLEDQLYRVTPQNAANKIGPYFFLAGNQLLKRQSLNTYRDVFDYIDGTLRDRGHEVVDVALLNDLGSHGNIAVDVTPVATSSKGNSHYMKRTINSTYKASRSKSHTDVESTLSKIDKHKFTDKLVVHHLDGSEWNDNPDNLIGLDGDAMHQLVHQLPLVAHSGSSYTWSGRLIASVYDPATKSHIVKPCRVTIDIK